MTVEIRSNTVLPARREPVVLRTSDGLKLIGELALPEHRDPIATLVTLHPLPTAGGFMDSHIIRKASFRLPALADMAVLRFNTRGTSSPQGRSDGAFDEGIGERFDVESAIVFAHERGLPHRWVMGWSFGADLALKYGCRSTIEGAVLLSPPLRYATDDDLDTWAAAGLAVTAVIPELDDYLRPTEAKTRFARVPRATVIGVQGAKHLWVGEKYVQRALNEIVGAIAPTVGPLPTTWDGPSATDTVTA